MKIKYLCINYDKEECGDVDDDYCENACDNLEYTRVERRLQALERIGPEIKGLESTLNHTWHLLSRIADAVEWIALPIKREAEIAANARRIEKAAKEREELFKKIAPYEYIGASFVCKILEIRAHTIVKLVREGQLTRHEVSGENCLGTGYMYKKDCVLQLSRPP